MLYNLRSQKRRNFKRSKNRLSQKRNRISILSKKHNFSKRNNPTDIVLYGGDASKWAHSQLDDVWDAFSSISRRSTNALREIYESSKEEAMDFLKQIVQLGRQIVEVVKKIGAVALEKMIEAGHAVSDAFYSLQAKLADLKNQAIEKVTWLKDKAKSMTGAAKEAIEHAIKMAKAAGQYALKKIKENTAALIKYAKEKTQAAVENSLSILKAGKDKLDAAQKRVILAARELIKDADKLKKEAMAKVSEGTASAKQLAAEKFEQAKEKIADASEKLSEIAKIVIKSVEDGAELLKSKVKEAWIVVKNTLTKTWNNITTRYKELKVLIQNYGKDVQEYIKKTYKQANIKVRGAAIVYERIKDEWHQRYIKAEEKIQNLIEDGVDFTSKAYEEATQHKEKLSIGIEELSVKAGKLMNDGIKMVKEQVIPALETGIIEGVKIAKKLVVSGSYFALAQLYEFSKLVYPSAKLMLNISVRFGIITAKLTFLTAEKLAVLTEEFLKLVDAGMLETEKFIDKAIEEAKKRREERERKALENASGNEDNDDNNNSNDDSDLLMPAAEAAKNLVRMGLAKIKEIGYISLAAFSIAKGKIDEKARDMITKGEELYNRVTGTVLDTAKLVVGTVKETGEKAILFASAVIDKIVRLPGEARAKLKELATTAYNYIEEKIDSVIDYAGEKIAEGQERISEIQKDINDQIERGEELAGEIAKKYLEAKAALSLKISQSQAVITAAITTVQDKVYDVFEAIERRRIELITAGKEAISTKINSLIDSANDLVLEGQEKVRLARELLSVLGTEYYNRVKKVAKDKLAKFREREEAAQKLLNQGKELVIEGGKKLAEIWVEIKDLPSRALNVINDTFVSFIVQLQEVLVLGPSFGPHNQLALEMAISAVNRLVKYSGELKTRTLELAKAGHDDSIKLANYLINLAIEQKEQMDEGFYGVEEEYERLYNDANETGNKLMASIYNIKNKLRKSINKMKDELMGGVGEIYNHIADTIYKKSIMLKSKIINLGVGIKTAAEEKIRQIDSLLSEGKKLIKNKAVDLKQTAIEKFNNAHALASEVAAMLVSSARRTKKAITNTVQNASNAIERTKKAISDVVYSMADSLREKGNELLKEYKNKKIEFKAQMESKVKELKRKKTELKKWIKSKTDELNELKHKAEDLLARANNATKSKILEISEYIYTFKVKATGVIKEKINDIYQSIQIIGIGVSRLFRKPALIGIGLIGLTIDEILSQCDKVLTLVSQIVSAGYRHAESIVRAVVHLGIVKFNEIVDAEKELLRLAEERGEQIVSSIVNELNLRAYVFVRQGNAMLNDMGADPEEVEDMLNIFEESDGEEEEDEGVYSPTVPKN